MRLLLRYQAREVSASLGVWTAFLFLMLFFLFFLRTQALLGAAVRTQDIALIVAYISPRLLVTSLPIALMLAIVFGLGRLNEDNELVALRALGLGPGHLLAAPLGAGAVVAALLAVLGLYVMPWGLSQMRWVLNDVVRRNVAQSIQPGTFHQELAGVTLYVDSVDAKGRWKNVLVEDERESGAPMVVLAPEGGSRASARGPWLELWFQNGQIHSDISDSYSVLDFQTAQMDLELGSSAFRGSTRWGEAFDDRTVRQLRDDARAAEQSGQDPRPYKVALHSRLAQLWTPFAFAAFGTPLAIAFRRKGRARGFILTLAAYVGFFMLLQLAEQLGVRGTIPAPVAGHLANGVFSTAGAGALAWMARRG